MQRELFKKGTTKKYLPNSGPTKNKQNKNRTANFIPINPSLISVTKKKTSSWSYLHHDP